jgi:hypothetical protein
MVIKSLEFWEKILKNFKEFWVLDIDDIYRDIETKKYFRNMENLLTLDQEIRVEIIKRELPKLSRDKLEEYLIQMIEQKYFFQNASTKLMKKELGIDEEETLKL